MSRTVVRVEVDRVVVTGADVATLRAPELRAMVERAVARAVERAPLPAGRAAHGSVGVEAASLASPPAVAAAVARGVVHAMGGGRGHG
jgi:hypothetical protein